MNYEKELAFIVAEGKKAFHTFADQPPKDIEQKTAFDLVTDIDRNIEAYIAEAIRKNYPDDIILGEEMSGDALVSGRTWTIDPIDGTCNMASDMELFGIQCSLIDNGEIVVAFVYVPCFDYTFTAIKNQGCYLNGQRVFAKRNAPLNSAIISFGDYPHKSSDRIADWQHTAIKKIYNKVAKIRMFGAACIDFSFVASGKTDGTVVITTNLWDIAPGILLCREAGATVVDLNGKDYAIGADGVIVGADERVAEMLTDAFAHEKAVLPHCDRKFEAVIFDFDGVILDTEKFHHKAWEKVFERYGLRITFDEYAPLRSTGREHVIAFFDQKYGLGLTAEEKAELAKQKGECFDVLIRDLSEGDLIASAREFLDYLKACFTKMAVASSGKTVKAHLKQFGLENYFDAVLDGNESFAKKPRPDIFLEAARRVNVRPEDCLVFEDSAAGIEAAIAAGTYVVCVGDTACADGIRRIKDFGDCFEK